jgi:transcriptional regulator with XRE-family HTH domain
MRRVKVLFANTIKEILESYKVKGKNLTQNDLAKVLGMTKQSFSNKMQRDTFTVEDASKIAEFLNMQIIIKGEEEYIIK